MPGARPIFYWDTCLFLAWIKDEERPTGEMAGVREIIDRVKRRGAVLVTSVLTSTEVLQSKLPAGVDNLFSGLMRRIEQKSIDIKIAKLAHDLRDYYAQHADEFENKTLSTPDAIHLATAIIYRVNEFHTFDAKNGRNSLGLLPLIPIPADHDL